MKTIFIIVAILASIPLYARNNIKEILSSIEENNTTLKNFAGGSEGTASWKPDRYLPG